MLLNRSLYVERLHKQKDKELVKIITGIRRCGKSTLLFKLYYQRLLNDGIPADHIIRIAIDNIRNAALKNPTRLYEALAEKIQGNGRYYILLDEIQLVKDFEDVVNGIKRDFDCDIYITGSNSKFLSTDINTKFRGRGIELKLFPLSFSEYYGYCQGDRRKAFNEYMMYGGMPYLLQESEPMQRAEYLRTIADTVVTDDIIERYGIRSKDVLRSLLSLLCSSIGSYVSSRKIAATLKSNGHTTVDHKTVGSYIDHLCDSFLFYRANRYDIKGKAYLKTLYKYYAVDIGLRNAILNFRQIEPTHTIENIVYIELLHRGFIVDIGKNEQKEIDFIARNMKDTFYIQVSYTLVDEQTREREISSFRKIDDGYKKIIITMDDDPFTNLGNGYKKINLLDFLLDDTALEKA
jgi:predicted AAA+ superfamily ATPase